MFINKNQKIEQQALLLILPVTSLFSMYYTNNSIFLAGLLASSPTVVKWGIGLPFIDYVKIIRFYYWNLPAYFRLVKNLAMSDNR